MLHLPNWKVKAYNDEIAMAQAVSDVIQEFYVKQNINFNILMLTKKHSRMNFVVNEVAKRNIMFSRLARFTLRGYIEITSSTIFFVDQNFLNNFHNRIVLGNGISSFMKMLVVFDGKIRPPVSRILTFRIHNKVELFEYLLYNKGDKLILASYDWFSRSRCNSLTNVIINEFLKTSFRWRLKLRNREKFRNFHGCMLIIAQLLGTYVDTDGELHGEIFDIMDIVGKKTNFSVYRQLSKITSGVELVPHNERVLVPHMIAEATFYSFVTDIMDVTTAYETYNIRIMLTQPKLLNSFDKITMPFDLTTWILIIITFLFAFITILFVNQMPNHIQKLVYGSGKCQVLMFWAHSSASHNKICLTPPFHA